MQIRISNAVIGDANSIALLFNQYRMFYKLPTNNFASKQFIQERFKLQDSIIMVAKLQKEVIAFAQIYPSLSSVAMKPIWVINDLFVDENFRKLGAATKILESIERQAIENNIFSIKLATEKNNKAAKKLYELMGFKLNDRFDNYTLTPGTNIEE